ncbi:unnamed protein product [Trichogramma brassicae]|uniref:Uncharacterized protein n=1 Tax=Trichogramma brassicae TaxID=86971 RepID=A0A6H5IV87_9HYME|nr:unnamed protein product [Trichogramma brassicae]
MIQLFDNRGSGLSQGSSIHTSESPKRYNSKTHSRVIISHAISIKGTHNSNATSISRSLYTAHYCCLSTRLIAYKSHNGRANQRRFGATTADRRRDSQNGRRRDRLRSRSPTLTRIAIPACSCMHTPSSRDPSTNRNSRLQLKPRRKFPRKRRYELVQLSPSDVENEDDNVLLRGSPKLRKRSADEMLSTPKSQAKTSPELRTPRRPVKAKRRLLDDLDKIAEEEAEELKMKQEAQKVTHRLFEGSPPKRIALEKKEEEEDKEVRTQQETKKTTRVLLFKGSTPKRLARLAM